MSTAEDFHKQASVAELKELFSQHLRAPDRLKKPEGCPTGLEAFDRFLFWGGLPKGALSLFRGALGTGTTSMWIESAARLVRDNHWVAWINSGVPLSPLSLHHKGMNLDRIVSVEAPGDEQKLLWLLQEMMSASLFDLIGCDLGSMRLKEHQVRKLQAQARESHVALVFLSQLTDEMCAWRGSIASVFSLIVSFENRCLRIERALHRQTPYVFPRSVNYARFTLHTGDRIGLGTNFLSAPEHPELQPDSVSASPRASFNRL